MTMIFIFLVINIYNCWCFITTSSSPAQFMKEFEEFKQALSNAVGFLPSLIS